MVKFFGGEVYLTSNVNDEIAADAGFALFVRQSLSRHLSGDWGDVLPEDKSENEFSLDKKLRLFSVYKDGGKVAQWLLSVLLVQVCFSVFIRFAFTGISFF